MNDRSDGWEAPSDEGGSIPKSSRWVGGAAAVLATVAVWLAPVAAALSPSGAEGDALVLRAAAIGGISLLAYLVALQRGLARAPSLGLVVGVALVARLVVVAGPLRLDDDLWRYLWDGEVTRAGISPYAFTPQAVLEFDPTWDRLLLDDADRFADLERLAELATDPEVRATLERINFPFYPTIYPPTSQWIFAAIRSERGFRLAIAVADLLVVLSLIALLGRLGRPREWSLGYAWNPLPILEFGAAGHQDVLGILALIAAITLLAGARGGLIRALSGALVGLSTGVKLFPVATLWCLRHRLGGAGLGSALATLAVITAPLVRLGPADFAGLQAYLSRWEYFSGPYAVLDLLLGDLTRIGVGVVLLTALWALSRRPTSGSGGLEATIRWIELCLLLSPVVDPWYVPWALALTVLRGSLAWPLFAVVIPLAYLPAPPEGHPVALRLAVWLPFLVVWGAEVWRSRSGLEQNDSAA